MPPAAKFERLWINAQEWGLGWMDRLQARSGRKATAPHLATGLRGERAALFELRRRGYVVVARRWTSAKMRGDLDLIAWDGDCLCFVEVKTRTARDMTPAESAVDEAKRQTLRGLARAYMRAFPEPQRRTIPVRFDVVSVYVLGGATEFELFEGAFGFR
ncbi:MAG TPA: YraN family protein [Acidobacteriaceae bacterium]